MEMVIRAGRPDEAAELTELVMRLARKGLSSWTSPPTRGALVFYLRMGAVEVGQSVSSSTGRSLPC